MPIIQIYVDESVGAIKVFDGDTVYTAVPSLDGFVYKDPDAAHHQGMLPSGFEKTDESADLWIQYFLGIPSLNGIDGGVLLA